MKYTVDARGKQCPIPVVETKKALNAAALGDEVETWVDNEIAVQNLEKMAKQKGMEFESRCLEPGFYAAVTKKTEEPDRKEEAVKEETVSIEAVKEKAVKAGTVNIEAAKEAVSTDKAKGQPAEANGMSFNVEGAASAEGLNPHTSAGTVVVLSSDKMGEGDEELGAVLMKGFIYALAGKDELPETVLMYNGGARLSVEGSASLEDLKLLEAQGVEILTCGTCLNHYGLTDKLAVGGITNMYTICEKMTEAGKVVKP